MGNQNLHRSKRKKNDEFFTRLSDVESELSHYSKCLHGKSIYLPCDDDSSAFWTYLMSNFETDGLERIVATRYAPGMKAFLLESSDGESLHGHHLIGDGDFFSDECQALMKAADVVITNPPFSRLREFVTSLIDAKKDFIIIAPMNAITYKNIFPHIKHGRIRIGHSGIMPMHFDTPDGSPKSVSCMWMTTFPIIRQCKSLELSATYDPARYPKYDNYDAIEVSRCKNIPVDYEGIMGVPITFLNYWQPENKSSAAFDVVGLDRYEAPKSCLRGGGSQLMDDRDMLDYSFELIGHEHDVDGDGGCGVSHGQFEVEGGGQIQEDPHSSSSASVSKQASVCHTG